MKDKPVPRSIDEIMCEFPCWDRCENKECQNYINYLEAKQSLHQLIEQQTNKARIESLQWALNDYNMPDTDTKYNLEQFIKDLGEKK